jgi:phosphatidate cytidylyltransferase
LCLSGVVAVAMTYLSEEIAPRVLGFAMGLYIAGNAIGGMLGRLVVGVIVDFVSWRAALGTLGGLALVAAVSGVLGDLVESMFKRAADVKDSGTLIPGHGGVLDRFDAMLLSAPFVFVYMLFVM